MPVTTLDRLPFGKPALITHLTAGAAPFRHKLLAMGLTPGCHVRVIRVAPLGDPLEIEMRGFHLCLRRSEAATIAVEELAS
ncbi:MAG: ferrous iron transport protein A [Burkholderiales bacterium]|jgi:ferrous iron transport protein A|nr:ferrous iron transport protein A [Burkholderiales bacterium]